MSHRNIMMKSAAVAGRGGKKFERSRATSMKTTQRRKQFQITILPKR